MNRTRWGTAIIVWLLLAQFSHAAEERQRIDETRQVRADERITLDVMRGDVSIRPSVDGAFRVSGLLDELADGFELESANGFTRFEVRMPRRLDGSRNPAESELLIEVPPGSDVEFKGVNAQLDVTGIHGGTKVTTVNGNVSASDLSGRVEISTVNGGIRTVDMRGNITLGTVNGDIEDTGSEGRLRISSINGRIETLSVATEAGLSVVNGRIRSSFSGTGLLKLSSVNGHVAVTLTDSPAPRIEGSTVSGGMELTLDRQTSARFRLTSSAGGSIHNSFSQDQASRAAFGPGRRLEFSAQEGTGTVELSSVSGRLELHRN